MGKVALWWRAARPFAFTVSVLPPILGAVIAVMENDDLVFHWFHFFLALIGCVIAHAAANMLSDYFDYKRQVDRVGTYGSSGVLVEKLMSPKQILVGALIAFAVSGCTGIYFVFAIPGGFFLVWLILIGGGFGFFYTTGPVTFKYRALGDIAVFVSFGSAMALGAYFVQAHHFSWKPVLYAIPLALLVDAVLHSNNLRDIKSDSVVDIKTLAMVLGEKGAIIMYQGLVFGAYIITILLIAAAGLTWISLITFLSFPLALKLVKTVQHKNMIPEQQFATIDASTAQLHALFGALFIVSLLLEYFVAR